jgi:hypothetical protein
MKISLLFAIALAVAGCASPPEVDDASRWRKPSASAAQTAQDLAACRLYAQSTSGQVLSRGIIPVTAEKNRRNAMVRDCMLSKGYTLISAP